MATPQKYVPNAVWWTDYPFTQLGDTAGKHAPYRPVTIGPKGYDGDKYVEIVLSTGEHTSVKAGYLFESPEDLASARTR